MITASFAADFSEFSGEVKKAETDLAQFEGAVDQTGSKIEGLGATSEKAIKPTSNLSNAYKQFDGVLSAAGINIGPVVKAFEDMGMASGKTATQLGAVTTAGLAVGTFMATFKLTSAILEFTGLNKVIGNAVDAIYDFGKSAEEQAARQDSINLAIKRGADAHISYAEAVRFNNTWAVDHKEKAKAAAEATTAWKDATAELNSFGISWQKTLATIDGTVVEAVKHYLEAGVSQTTLKDAYMLTEGQIKAVVAAMGAEKEELKALKALNEEVATAMKTHWDGVGKVVDQVFGVEALKKATTWVDAMDAIGISVANLSSKDLAELQETMLAGVDALARSGQLTSEQSSRFAELAVQAAAAQEALRPVVKVTEDLSKAQWDNALAADAVLASMKKAKDEADTIAAAAAGAKREQGAGAGVGLGLATTGGGIAYDIFGRPTIGTAGLAPTMGVTVNVDGSVLSTPYELANAVGAALTAQFRNSGRRLPV